MTTTDLIALIVTILGVASFAAVVTILFRNFIKSSIKEIHNGERDIELIDQTIYENDPKDQEAIKECKTLESKGPLNSVRQQSTMPF